MTDPVDTAWRIHGAVADWTGKAESKASFALAVESGALIAIIGLMGGNRRLANLHHTPRVYLDVGLGLLVLGLLSVVMVSLPRLRFFNLGKEVPDNFIYFGHLRKWKPSELESALTTDSPLPMLSRQLVVMSQIAWKKHRLLQLSLIFAVAGVLLVGAAAWLK